MPKLCRVLAAAGVLLCGELVSPANGATGNQKSLPLTIERMATEAHWIVEGTVIDVRSDWNETRTTIYTTVVLNVERVHKGTYGDGVMTLRTLGGVVDDIGLSVEGGLVFQPDERVVLFLGQNLNAFFPTIGQSQGVFHVVTDENGNEVVRNGRGATLRKSTLEQRIRRAIIQQ